LGHRHWIGCFGVGCDLESTKPYNFPVILVCYNMLDYVKVYVAILCRVLEELSEVLNEKKAVTSKDLEELQYLDQVHSLIVNLS